MEIDERKPSARPVPGASRNRGALQVVCFSTYVSRPNPQTVQQHAVRNFLLALRGERIDREIRVPVGAVERVLSPSNANDSIDWFGEMVAGYLGQNQIRPPFFLVPVPTSGATLDTSSGPWTSLLAISIVSNGLEEAEVVDALRWREPLSAPGRSTWTVAELYDNLVLTRRLDPAVPVLLVDYLYTTNSILRACAARLGEQGSEVPLALCAGRTTDREDHGAFTVVVGEIAPFEPGH